MNINAKIKNLVEERENISNEMAEIKRAFDVRQQRLVEIAGSLKTLQELLDETGETSECDCRTAEECKDCQSNDSK